MEKPYWIIHWIRQRNLAVVQSALREILIFMEKVDSDRQANLTFVIMDWKKGRMPLLCKELILGYLNGITGEYATPAGYFVDEKKAEEFDKMFHYKEKKKLPGQLF